MLQAYVNMGGCDAHIAHDEVRAGKDLRVDALQDKVIFPFPVQRDQEGAVDIAVAKFPDINNPVLRAKLLCYSKKVAQGLSSRMYLSSQ
jgi:hypothetical protein